MNAPVILVGPRYEHISLPGAAGQLYAIGDIVGLAAELGDHYDVYHSYLAEVMTGLRGRPEPVDFGGDVEAYARAFATLQEVLGAEAFLRRCFAKRQLGISFNKDLDRSVPLVDEWHRLVHFVSGSSEEPVDERNDPALWVPPPVPTGP